MKSGTVKESISRQLFEEEVELQQDNNNNITMQSEDQQHDVGGGDMNNNDVSHKNDNTSTANQHNVQEPMESQQDNGLDANELTSALMGDNNMNQQEEPSSQQHQDDSSSSESDEEESSSSSSEDDMCNTSSTSSGSEHPDAPSLITQPPVELGDNRYAALVDNESECSVSSIPDLMTCERGMDYLDTALLIDQQSEPASGFPTWMPIIEVDGSVLPISNTWTFEHVEDGELTLSEDDTLKPSPIDPEQASQAQTESNSLHFSCARRTTEIEETALVRVEDSRSRTGESTSDSRSVPDDSDSSSDSSSDCSAPQLVRRYSNSSEEVSVGTPDMPELWLRHDDFSKSSSSDDSSAANSMANQDNSSSSSSVRYIDSFWMEETLPGSYVRKVTDTPPPLPTRVAFALDDEVSVLGFDGDQGEETSDDSEISSIYGDEHPSPHLRPRRDDDDEDGPGPNNFHRVTE